MSPPSDTPLPAGPAIYRPPLRERIIAPVRKFGVRSFLVAITAIGVLAGILSASGQILPLWGYVLMTCGTFLVAVAAFTLSQPRYKFWLFSLLYGRRPDRDEGGYPYHLNIYGSTPRAPVLQIAAGRTLDRVYEGGLRTLLEAENPVAIIGSSPRDVTPGTSNLPAGMFSKGGSRTECVVDPRVFGIPLEPYGFERELAGTVLDVDHFLAVRDLLYLPHLAQALRGGDALWRRSAEPFLWPQHCIDIPFITDHDVVVIGGGDSNFWHAALYEPVFRRFREPESTIPLALDLRDYSSIEASSYSSRTINVQLARREGIPGLEDAKRFELDERRFPTCGMILACENPYARAAGKQRWCVFVAGTRSLGTSGAVLALAAMLERLRTDEAANFFSVVETAETGVLANVSAMLCRVVEAEFAAEAADGRIRKRGRAEIPTDRADPNYRDSYVPTCVEILDNTGEMPEWRRIVRLGEPERERAPGDEAVAPVAGV